MNKKLISAVLCGAMVLGCTAPVLAEGEKIALVGKSAGNAFFEIAADSFVDAAEGAGATVDVVYPETATADAQIKVLDNLISQQPDAICISANDVNALQAKLEEAMDAGIKVSSFDSAPNADSRQVFINQAGTNAVGQALLDNYPDLKVICAPTTVGIAAAAKLLQDNGSACKLTGLGLPSEMLEYTGDDDEHSCPYFYLWDMQGLGKLSALATLALINDEITGELGETFTAGDLGDYEITEADDGGTEIVLGLPLEFNSENIEEMAKLY